GGRRPEPLFELPANARSAGCVDLWCERMPPRRLAPGARRRHPRPTLPAELARTLLGWRGDLDALVDALAWCRANPDVLRPTFRSLEAWERFVAALLEVVAAHDREAG